MMAAAAAIKGLGFCNERFVPEGPQNELVLIWLSGVKNGIFVDQVNSWNETFV